MTTKSLNKKAFSTSDHDVKSKEKDTRLRKEEWSREKKSLHLGKNRKILENLWRTQQSCGLAFKSIQPLSGYAAYSQPIIWIEVRVLSTQLRDSEGKPWIGQSEMIPEWWHQPTVFNKSGRDTIVWPISKCCLRGITNSETQEKAY